MEDEKKLTIAEMKLKAKKLEEELCDAESTVDLICVELNDIEEEIAASENLQEDLGIS